MTIPVHGHIVIHLEQSSAGKKTIKAYKTRAYKLKYGSVSSQSTVKLVSHQPKCR